jgi:hypothetical protein
MNDVLAHLESLTHKNLLRSKRGSDDRALIPFVWLLIPTCWLGGKRRGAANSLSCARVRRGLI